MIRPLDNSFDAFYYDGLAAIRHPAIVKLSATELDIGMAGRPALTPATVENPERLCEKFLLGRYDSSTVARVGQR